MAKNFITRIFKKDKSKKAEMDNLAKQYETNDHIISKEEIKLKYKTDFEKGLTEEEAAEKLKEFGPNSLTPPKETPLIVKFLKEMFVNIFNILLNAGSVLCFVAYILRKNIEYVSLAVVLLSVVFITSTATVYQNYSSGQKMKSFRNLLPPKVNVMRNGALQEKFAADIVPGDIINIRPGDKIPSDMLVVECSQDAKVDNSSITGESEPLLRRAEMTNEEPLETANLLFFGTLLVQGNAKAMVTRTGDSTLLGRIAQLTAMTKAEKTPIGKEISHFIKIISVIAVLLGVGFGLASLFITGGDAIDIIIFIIGIIVANVPEGLPATLTMSLTIASRKMTKNSVLVKNLEGVETLGSTSLICSDKTGTLTINKMTVTHIFFDQKERMVQALEPEKGDFEKEDPIYQKFIRCGTLCNKAVYNENNMIVGDASESALLKFCKPNLSSDVTEYREKHKAVHSIPFNSKNKWQLSIHKDTDKNAHVIVMKGAPEKVLQFCEKIYADGEAQALGEEGRKRIAEGLMNFARQGERVLGLCELELPFEKFPANFEFQGDLPENANFPFSQKEGEGFVFIGLSAMIDPPRPSVPRSVLRCQEAGIRVFMVTGDHPTTARAIATKVNIIKKNDRVFDMNEMETPTLEDIEASEADACVVVGHHINTFLADVDDNAKERFWNAVLSHKRIVFSRTSPQHKLLIVSACQNRNSVVAVTGDGVNDSPALKKADIGVAMGIAGTDVAKEAANMILLDDNFNSIVKGVEEGRVMFDNLKKSIVYTLTSNIPEISPFLLSVLLGIPLPLKTVQIFTIDLGTDMVPAISMAKEKKESDIMKIPPRNPRRDRLVSSKTISFSYGIIGVMQALSSFFAYAVVFGYYGFKVSYLLGLTRKGEFESCADEHKYLSCASHKSLFGGKYCKFTSNPLTENLSELDVENMECKERKRLLGESNAAYVISIVIVQVADVMISKTRRNSVFQQGMGNIMMNIGILFELALISLLTYVPPLARVFSFSSVKARFWIPPLPFFMVILTFDETRKFLLRRNFNGWVKRNTYW